MSNAFSQRLFPTPFPTPRGRALTPACSATISTTSASCSASRAPCSASCWPRSCASALASCATQPPPRLSPHAPQRTGKRPPPSSASPSITYPTLCLTLRVLSHQLRHQLLVPLLLLLLPLLLRRCLSRRRCLLLLMPPLLLRARLGVWLHRHHPRPCLVHRPGWRGADAALGSGLQLTPTQHPLPACGRRRPAPHQPTPFLAVGPFWPRRDMWRRSHTHAAAIRTSQALRVPTARAKAAQASSAWAGRRDVLLSTAGPSSSRAEPSRSHSASLYTRRGGGSGRSAPIRVAPAAPKRVPCAGDWQYAPIPRRPPSVRWAEWPRAPPARPLAPSAGHPPDPGACTGT
jgi:hypothetical protein